MQVTLTFDISKHLTEAELDALMSTAEAKGVSLDTYLSQIARENLASNARRAEADNREEVALKA